MSDPDSFRGLQVVAFGHPRSELRRELVDPTVCQRFVLALRYPESVPT